MPSSFLIQNPYAVKTVVKNLAPGVYQFKLRIADNRLISASATVQIAVLLSSHIIKAKIIEDGLFIKSMSDGTQMVEFD